MAETSFLKTVVLLRNILSLQYSVDTKLQEDPFLLDYLALTEHSSRKFKLHWHFGIHKLILATWEKTQI